MGRCSLGHYHPSAQLSQWCCSCSSPRSPSECWEGARQTSRGLTRAAQPRPRRGSRSSWGTSLTSDIVSEFRLFRSPWLGCFCSCSCRLQPCSAALSLSSHRAVKGGVAGSESVESAQVWLQTWGRGSFQLRSIFWDLEVEVSLLLLQLLLQAEGTCRGKSPKVLSVPSTWQEMKGMAGVWTSGDNLKTSTVH